MKQDSKEQKDHEDSKTKRVYKGFEITWLRQGAKSIAAFAMHALLVAIPALQSSAKPILLYRIEMPPSGNAGVVINDEWYYFSNAGPWEKCITIRNGCFIPSGIRVKRLGNGVIKIGNEYGCPEVGYVWGKCSARGWLRSKEQPPFHN